MKMHRNLPFNLPFNFDILLSISTNTISTVHKHRARFLQVEAHSIQRLQFFKIFFFSFCFFPFFFLFTIPCFQCKRKEEKKDMTRCRRKKICQKSVPLGVSVLCCVYGSSNVSWLFHRSMRFFSLYCFF